MNAQMVSFIPANLRRQLPPLPPPGYGLCECRKEERMDCNGEQWEKY